MDNNSRRPPPRPPAHVMAEIRAHDLKSYDDLIAWWTALKGPHAWLRRLPADVAARMADQGVPDPATWRPVRSHMAAD